MMLGRLWRALWSRQPRSREGGPTPGVAGEPADAEALNARGAALLAAKDINGAVAAFRKAIAARPQFADACSNLAYALVLQEDRIDEALHWAQRATQLAPQMAAGYCNLAIVLQLLNRGEESLAAAEVAIRLAPGLKQAQYCRSFALLALGRFAEGWVDHEARRDVLVSFRLPCYEYPEWRGEDLAGRNVLVYAEQGLGDEIMFAGCLPELMARSAHCAVEISPKLASLFARSFPGAAVSGQEQTARDLSWPKGLPFAVDFQVPIGSLPLYFRREWSAFPRHVGYLVADPGRRRGWRLRLDALGPGLKVGISWHGGTGAPARSPRSIPLAEWTPVLTGSAAVHFISLQYTDCRDEISAVTRSLGVPVHHWQEAIDSYEDTAALTAELDLVVSVRTAAIHLAGALGKPVWALLSTASEWRYLSNGESMPWYPSARLFRQESPGEWGPVLKRIGAELKQWAAAR